MAALFYLVERNVINFILSLKKKKGVLFLYSFFLVIVVFMLIAGSRNTFNHQWLSDRVRSITFALLSLLMGYFAVSNGLKKGSTFFRMADVNLVFPSPIDRRSILIYGFIRQLGISLLIVAYMFFQIANIQNLFGIPYNRLWVFFSAVLGAVLYMPVCSMVIHASVLRKPEREQMYSRMLMACFAVLCVAFVYLLLRSKDPISSGYRVLGTGLIDYLPVIGWFKTILEASVSGFSTYAIVSAILLIAGFIALVWYLLRSDIDYFEDVLNQTERREQRIIDKRAGKTDHSTHVRVRKVKSFYRGGGPSAIFYRQQLEYRKSGFFWMDTYTIILIVIGLTMAYLLKDNPLRMEFILYVNIYILFILSMTGRWGSELNTHYIYLIPGKPLAKLWYATLSNHIKHFVDGLLLFAIIGQVFGTPFMHRFLLAGCYTSFGALYVYGDVLFMRMFLSSYDSFAAGMLKLFSISILALPAIAILIAGTIIARGSLYAIGISYACVIVYAAVFSFLVMLFGKKLFSSK